MELSFIIVNYQSKKYLEYSINSIFNHIHKIKFEIIVVNNDKNKIILTDNQRSAFLKDSKKNSNAVITKHNDNKLKIVEVNKNVGFGQGCNIGANKANGKILCFLNPDTKIISENIENILTEFTNNKKVGAVGPKIIKENGKVQKWIVGEEVTLWKILKNNFGFVDDKKLWTTNKKREVAWVTGAVLFIRRSLFKKLKGFDENFFMYFEDIDLCKRIRLANYVIIYSPNFTVQHFGGKSIRSHSQQKKEYYKSQDYYFEKWFGKIAKWSIATLRFVITAFKIHR